MLKDKLTLLCVAFLGVEMLLLTYLDQLSYAQTIIGGLLVAVTPYLAGKVREDDTLTKTRAEPEEVKNE